MKILILGGTAEAAGLARALAGDAGVATITSLAGRTRAPAAVPGEVRVGGFGGPVALVDYLAREAIGLVDDATHPFAARISRNAAQACQAAGVPRLLLARPPWTTQAGDNGIPAANAEAAAAALPGLGRRVFLAIGRQELAAFAELTDNQTSRKHSFGSSVYGPRGELKPATPWRTDSAPLLSNSSLPKGGCRPLGP